MQPPRLLPQPEDICVLRGHRLIFLAPTMVLAVLLRVPRNFSGLSLGTCLGYLLGRCGCCLPGEPSFSLLTH